VLLLLLVKFRLDKWTIVDHDAFDFVVGQCVAKMASMSDKDEAMMLCLRFLSFVLVEKEELFDSFFIANSQESLNARFILLTFLERKWINKATGQELKKFMQEGYFPFFQEGITVKYRKLDEEDKLSELVDVTIVSVVQDEPGVFYVRFNDTAENEAPIEKQTTIERLQPDRIQ
jgi:hypothetical protein